MLRSSSSSSYHCEHGLLLSPSINGAAAPPSIFDSNGGSYSSSLLSSSHPPYSSFLPPFYLHRSSSSAHHIRDQLNHQPPLYSATAAAVPEPSLSSPSPSSGDLLGFNSGPVRRVFSTGDLQGMNGLQVSGENYGQEVGTNAGRVVRYSAEERKERIERYRSKRNHRNFHKKITYACRKTLADSRPRVRGRFARNGENEAETEAEAAISSFDCYSSYGIYDQGPSCSSIIGNYDSEFWRQMQAALAPAPAPDEDYECSYDEELLASFADVFSMNLLS